MPQASWGVVTDWLTCFLIDEERFACTQSQCASNLYERARATAARGRRTSCE